LAAEGFLPLAAAAPFSWRGAGRNDPPQSDLSKIAADPVAYGFFLLQGSRQDRLPAKFWIDPKFRIPQSGLPGPDHVRWLLVEAVRHRPVGQSHRIRSQDGKLLVIVAESLAHFASADRLRGAILLNGGLIRGFRRELSLKGSEREALSDALLLAGLCHGLNALLAAGADRSNDDLLNLFRFAVGYRWRLNRILSRPEGPLLPVAPARLRWVLQEIWLETLARGSNYEREKALRAVRQCADLSLLPRIAARYRRESSPAARSALLQAHRGLAVKAYPVTTAEGIRPVTRSTIEGRLARVDEDLFDLLQRLADPREHGYRGVDLDAWREGLDRNRLMVLDQAVADGTTTLDLLEGLDRRRSRFGNLELEVIASDVAMILRRMVLPDGAAVFDASGALVQLEVEGSIMTDQSLQRSPSPALSRRWREVLKRSRNFSQSPELETISLLNPRLAAYRAAHPGRVSLRQHDVFRAYRPRAGLIRVFDLLYRRLHADADAPSYFDRRAIVRALIAIGRSLRQGGVVLIGSVVDSRAKPEVYVDYEIRQRLGSGRRARLALCDRGGGGVVLPQGDIPLGAGRWRPG
jgi:hypothetical protein